jgi:hypothetical protein
MNKNVSPNKTNLLALASMVLSMISLIVAIGTVASADDYQIVVNSKDIANGSIQSVDIANGAVKSADIGTGTVRTVDIGKEAITVIDIAKEAVDTSKVANEAITATDIAKEAVDTSKVADDSLSSADYAPGSVDTPALDYYAATNEKLANLSVDARNMREDSVESTSILDGAVLLQDFGVNPARVATSNTTPQAIPNAGLLGTDVAFDAESLDSGLAEMHSTVSNNTRLVAPRTGVYQVTGSVTWDTNANGWRRLEIWRTTPGFIQVSASVASSTVNAVAASDQGQAIDQLVYMKAGEWVTLKAQQSSGAPLNIEGGGDASARFSAAEQCC